MAGSFMSQPPPAFASAICVAKMGAPERFSPYLAMSSLVSAKPYENSLRSGSMVKYAA